MLAVLAACILSVVFIFFYQHFKDYFGFLNKWSSAKNSLTLTKPITEPKIELPAPYSRLVAFSTDAEDAEKVFLTGNFYGGEKIPLNKTDDGLWQVKVVLAGGKYFYNFEIDGETVLDSKNPETVKSEDKTYSVLTVKK